jgi:DNA-directed RNA polymerase subunit beta
LNSIITGDRNYAFDSNDSFANAGFTTQAVNEESGQIENEEVDMDDEYDDAPDAMDFASDLVGLADSDEE